MEKDISEHLSSCNKCQVTKVGKMAPELLSPLPQCTEPNQRVHADLFGPLKTSEGEKKFILCLTDAFTKYAIVTIIVNKKAETVSDAIYKEWFQNFESHTDRGKEIVNKLSAELFDLMNVSHTKTTPVHPQCNAQVEELFGRANMEAIHHTI